MRRRGRVTLRIAAGVCVLGALALIVSSRPDDAPATVASPAPTSPPDNALSARRVPMLFTDAVSRVRLTQSLSTVVAPYDACVTVATPDEQLATIGNQGALTPASSLKLLTATAALANLDKDFRFRTRALTDDDGNLVVVGGGDPLLATPDHIAEQHANPRFADAPYTDLAALADAIVAGGVDHVEALVVDDSHHDEQRVLPDWKANYVGDGEIGSLGALTINGGYVELGIAATDPAVFTGQQLAALLDARGVTVAGGVERGTAATNASEVAHIDSAPIGAVVGEMLASSDNYTAEAIMREIAADADSSTPGTTERGIEITRATLTELGIPLDGVEMHDGSGLSPTDRATCAALEAVIGLSARPQFAPIDDGLSVAARRGTMVLRFVGDPLVAVLRAKTGSINNVVALAGIVDDDEHARFAFVANGDFSLLGGQDLQAAVAHAIAGYPEVSDPAGVVPAP